MLQEVIMAGFGGQGILSMGQLLTYAGLHEDREVSWIPSYGPEMRGGTANCSVVISKTPVSSPMVTEPNALVIMNLPSLDKFIDTVKPGGVAVINSSLVDKKVERTDIKVVEVPANQIAEELGNGKVASIVILGALVELTGMVQMESVVESLKKVLPPHRHKLIPLNQAALEKGAEYVKSQQ